MTLGRLQLRAGKADVAVPILEKVAAQAPWAAEPLLLLYEAQISQGKIDEAESRWCRPREINPRYFAQLGQFYERQGKWAEAAAAYEEAIGGARQPSRDLQIRYAAALINTEGGAAKAREVLAELLKASPNDTRVLYMLSTAERTAGRRQGRGSDRAQDPRDRSDQRRRPARARRGAVRSIRLQADRRRGRRRS